MEQHRLAVQFEITARWGDRKLSLAVAVPVRRATAISSSLIVPGLVVTLVGGITGGVFSRLLIASLICVYIFSLSPALISHQLTG